MFAKFHRIWYIRFPMKRKPRLQAVPTDINIYVDIQTDINLDKACLACLVYGYENMQKFH